MNSREPVEGIQHDTIVILAVDNRADLDRWLSSEIRHELLTKMEAHVEGDRTVNVVGGFAGWFAPTGSPAVKRWKSAVVVLLALIPVNLLYTAARLSLFPDLAIVPAVIIGNVIGIVVLSWILMPVLTRRFSGWLRH